MIGPHLSLALDPAPTVVLPRCAVCGHDVEQLDTYNDVVDGVWILTAICHGETEEVRLTQAEMVSMASGGRIEMGDAFVRRALPVGRP